MTEPRGLLSGVTVADFGWAVAGPVLGRYLAHHGATVVRIESNTKLDNSRASPPFGHGRPSRNGSGFFEQHNAGKLSINLNLKNPIAKKIAGRLAVWADLVSENFAPGVMDGLGLGYRNLSAERADLIMLSASMQGQSGPNAGHPGLGVTLQALVGISHLTGWPDREPVGAGQPYTDMLAAWMAGTAGMAMLDYRRRTGRGGHLDLSQFEATVHFFAPALLHEQLTDSRHIRQGNSSDVRVPEDVYPCRGDDRWCAISVETDAQWRALAAIIEFPSADAPVAAQDFGWRAAHREAIDHAISAWTREREAAEVQTSLQRCGVPAAIVAAAKDIVEDPQLEARDHWLEREHPRIGPFRYERPPYRLSEHGVTMRRAPLMGEHTDHVLKDFLGMSESDIAAARESGALE